MSGIKEGAVVLTVNVTVVGLEPFSVTDGVEGVHVDSVNAAGSLHVTLTVSAKPPCGVTVKVKAAL